MVSQEERCCEDVVSGRLFSPVALLCHTAGLADVHAQKEAQGECSVGICVFVCLLRVISVLFRSLNKMCLSKVCGYLNHVFLFFAVHCYINVPDHKCTTMTLIDMFSRGDDCAVSL